MDLLGQADANLRAIHGHTDARVVVRGEELWIDGKPRDIELLKRLFTILVPRAREGVSLTEHDVVYVLSSLTAETEEDGHLPGDALVLKCPKAIIRCKTRGQREYLEAIAQSDIVICIGPAGTGKTYLAVARAVHDLVQRHVDRIVLVRPAVEAGESLGFLPGDYREKVDPYLRPLYDALYDMMPADRMRRLMDNRVIEVAPLAYMRGRTLNRAFVILDEAQNTTSMQMKMFLTRLGIESKAIVTGDITQIDLAPPQQSGLVEVQSILQSVVGISFIYLTKSDVVRHPIVQHIIQAYEEYEPKS